MRAVADVANTRLLEAIREGKVEIRGYNRATLAPLTLPAPFVAGASPRYESNEIALPNGVQVVVEIVETAAEEQPEPAPATIDPDSATKPRRQRGQYKALLSGFLKTLRPSSLQSRDGGAELVALYEAHCRTNKLPTHLPKNRRSAFQAAERIRQSILKEGAP
jgi:hypothetical protein